MPIDDVNDLDPGAQSVTTLTADKFRLTSIAIYRDRAVITWETGENMGGEFRSYFNDSLTVEDTEAVLDDDGNEIEPASTLWTQFKGTQQLQALVTLIRTTLRNKGLV